MEKFNTNLSGAASRVYATYLGGSGKDIGSTDGNGGPGKAIAIDASGNAYITGSTGSTNFPLANASQGVIGGQNDAFLTKLNATGTGPLIYSTYLGGNGDDFGRSVAVNVAGSAYVTGAAGANFPTLSPLPTPLASVGFVTKFTPSGAVLYSTLLSGVTASTGSFGIAVDGAGNAFATGGTNASIVTTAGAFQTDAGPGGTVGWVTVIADPTIIGRVVDENGNPLVGATVNLTWRSVRDDNDRREWWLHVWATDGRQQLHGFSRRPELHICFRGGEQSPKERETGFRPGRRQHQWPGDAECERFERRNDDTERRKSVKRYDQRHR